MKNVKLKYISIAIVFVLITFYFLLTKHSSHSNLPRNSANEDTIDLKTDPSSVLATVGDESITAEELQWELNLHTTVPKVGADDSAEKPASLRKESNAELEPTKNANLSLLKQRLLVTLIERTLLHQWIQNFSEGFDFNDPARFESCMKEHQELIKSTPEVVSTPSGKEFLKSKLCKESLIGQYLNEKILPANEPREAELLKYYKDHMKEFSEPQRVIFKQIFLPTEQAAIKLRPQVTKANFSDLAKQHSIAPEAAQGGRLGPFRREQLPTFFDIVFNMQNDEISGIIRSDYGFHILSLIQKMPPETKSFQQVKGTIQKKLRDEAKQKAYQSWLTVAMNAIKVTSSTEGVSN